MFRIPMGSSKANTEVVLAIGSWMFCSIGMLLFNKLAVSVFPAACTLVSLQMVFTALVVVAVGWKTLYIGSFQDVLRWSMVIPFFVGMLLSSILALKHAPMSLVVTFRSLSPLVSLAIERLYPNPLRISTLMLIAIGVMITGTVLYALQMPSKSWGGVQWVLLNNVFAIGDRLLQRLMLAKDQKPVDISKTSLTLLNNVEGLLRIFVCAWLTHEFSTIPSVIANIHPIGWLWVIASCFVGAGIAYTGIWAQSLISATSLLVLVNSNKFVIIFIEVFCLRHKTVTGLQILGAIVAICGGALYGRARSDMENAQKDKSEQLPLNAGSLEKDTYETTQHTGSP